MKEKILKEIQKRIRFLTGMKKPPKTLQDYQAVVFLHPIAAQQIIPLLQVLYSLKEKIERMR